MALPISLLLAKIFGLYLLVAGLALLFKPKKCRKFTDQFRKDSHHMMMAGFIAFALGLLLVLKHNLWVSSWEVVLTVVAWITLVKGVVYIFFPETVGKMIKSINNKGFMLAMGIICLLVGLYLSYMGFWA